MSPQEFQRLSWAVRTAPEDTVDKLKGRPLHKWPDLIEIMRFE